MCILLSRHFRCWSDPDPDPYPGLESEPRPQPQPTPESERKPRGHVLRYVVRCANPYPKTCLVESILSKVRQHFDDPCPECTCTFVEPFDLPYKIEKVAPNIDGSDSIVSKLNDAARAYTTALCGFLVALFSDGSVTYDVADLVERWKVCNMEAACVFDPQHFSTTAVCDCHEANETPELRNMSHAIRCRFARRAVADHEALREVYEQVNAHESVPFRRSALKHEYQENHPPIQASNHLKGIPILPVGQRIWVENEDPDGGILPKLLSSVTDALQSYGSEETWNNVHNEQENPTTCSLPPRVKILHLMAVLIAEDCGLTGPHGRRIFEHLLSILRPEDGFFTGESISESYGSSMLALLRLQTFFDGRQCAGNALLDPIRLLNLTVSLAQKRSLHFNDEHVFESALKRFIEPVRQSELDADKELRCSLCHDEMIAVDRPPPEAREFEHPGTPVALRVLCTEKHIFCIKCWMGYWKTQTADGQPDVRCHVCNEKMPLWRPNVPPLLGDADWFDPNESNKNLQFSLKWPSQTPTQRPPGDWALWDPLLGPNPEPRAEPLSSLLDVQQSRLMLSGSPTASVTKRRRRVEDVYQLSRGNWLDADGLLMTARQKTRQDRPFELKSVGSGADTVVQGRSFKRAGWIAASRARDEGALVARSQGKRVGSLGSHTRAQSRAAFLAQKKNRMRGRGVL
ncbi:hypothetical protein ACHAQA_009671 [Verticillium albo-atrum]